MKYNELIAYYQEKILTEKGRTSNSAFDNPRQFNTLKKLSGKAKHMRGVKKGTSNEYRPYNDNTKKMSNAANQALLRIDHAGTGVRHDISNDIASEILFHYKRGTINGLNEELPKLINPKSKISVVRSNGKIYLQKD